MLFVAELCVFCVAEVDRLTNEIEDLYAVSSQRAVTGTLSSHPDCRDVHIDSLSITFHGSELLVDTRLELNNGRRYGLIGLNGCGLLRPFCDYLFIVDIAHTVTQYTLCKNVKANIKHSNKIIRKKLKP